MYFLMAGLEEPFLSFKATIASIKGFNNQYVFYECIFFVLTLNHSFVLFRKKKLESIVLYYDMMMMCWCVLTVGWSAFLAGVVFLTAAATMFYRINVFYKVKWKRKKESFDCAKFTCFLYSKILIRLAEF